MPNVPQRTEAVTSDQMLVIAASLESMANTLRASAAVAENQENKALACYSFSNAKSGLVRVESFANDTSKAARLAQLGTPRKVDELKARSTVGKLVDRLQKAHDDANANKRPADGKIVMRKKKPKE